MQQVAIGGGQTAARGDDGVVVVALRFGQLVATRDFRNSGHAFPLSVTDRGTISPPIERCSRFSRASFWCKTSRALFTSVNGLLHSESPGSERCCTYRALHAPVWPP